MTAIAKRSFQSDYAIPPGETLRKIMDAQSMAIESIDLLKIAIVGITSATVWAMEIEGEV